MEGAQLGNKSGAAEWNSMVGWNVMCFLIKLRRTPSESGGGGAGGLGEEKEKENCFSS